eukprot:IDg10195t1
MPVMKIVEREISIAGGLDSIVNYQEEVSDRGRIFSAPHNSNSMLSYSSSIPNDGKLIAIDLYADGTTLTSSGSQSACVFRIRLVNVYRRSEKWHNIAIAPVYPTT